jgi:hypothetical protein
MKYLAPLYLVMVIGLAVGSEIFAQESPSGSKREILTNNSIISLTKAGFKERTIITIIRTSETNFDVSTLQLVQLKKSGVSERIITEMVERTRSGDAMRRMTSLSDDEFFAKDDDAFFNGSSIFKELPSEKEARKKEADATIFGSKSGSGSKTQTEVKGQGPGPSSQNDQQGELTGSATVRILRPAGEAGAVPKLERAPKLDNQAVLALVQAGFSEGTIIRRIESSQVDFDLSPKALSDLRKNRVTEQVIKAMTQAMDESK